MPRKLAKKQSIVRPQQIVYSQEQALLKQMFGGHVGQPYLGDLRPKITHTLSPPDGYGLMKNNDQGETKSLMLPVKGRKFTI